MDGKIRLLLGPDPGELAGMGASASPEPGENEGLQASQSGGDRTGINGETQETGEAGAGERGVDATTPTAPADPNQAASAAEWQSIREAAQGLGYQFAPTIADDRAALQHLIAQAQANKQADYFAQLGRQLAPHYQGIQGYLQQQAKPPEKAPTPWQPPNFDRRWAGLVVRDEATGLYVGKPGVDPSIPKAVNDYAEWTEKFQANPAEFLEPMVEQRANAIVDARVKEQFARYQAEQTIQSIATENAPWLYATDPNGQRAIGQDGRSALSPLGARYVTQLQAVAKMGVSDPRQQDALAKQLVRGELALAQQQEAAGRSGQAASPQTQGSFARPNQNPLQAQPPVQRRQNPAATEPTGTGMSLSEMLRQGFAAEGVSDRDFAFEEA